MKSLCSTVAENLRQRGTALKSQALFGNSYGHRIRRSIDRNQDGLASVRTSAGGDCRPGSRALGKVRTNTKVFEPTCTLIILWDLPSIDLARPSATRLKILSLQSPSKRRSANRWQQHSGWQGRADHQAGRPQPGKGRRLRLRRSHPRQSPPCSRAGLHRKLLLTQHERTDNLYGPGTSAPIRLQIRRLPSRLRLDMHQKHAYVADVVARRPQDESVAERRKQWVCVEFFERPLRIHPLRDCA